MHFDYETMQFPFQIRKTQNVSVVPVGYIGKYLFDTPIVKNGKVVDFNVNCKCSKMFPIDMAGFAVSIKFLKHVGIGNLCL